MASRENRSFLKRCLEKDLNIPNKRFKSGEEIELFCENQNEKVVRVVGRGGRSWKSSYQRYKSSYYGGRNKRNMYVKSKTANKEKEEDGIKDNIENADFVKIEDLVVWQPTIGSDAFNEGFEVSDLNKIEAFVEEDGDVVEQFWETMKSVKLLSVKLDSLIMKMRKYQIETMKIFKSMK